MRCIWVESRHFHAPWRQKVAFNKWKKKTKYNGPVLETVDEAGEGSAACLLGMAAQLEAGSPLPASSVPVLFPPHSSAWYTFTDRGTRIDFPGFSLNKWNHCWMQLICISLKFWGKRDPSCNYRAAARSWRNVQWTNQRPGQVSAPGRRKEARKASLGLVSLVG